MVHITAVLYKTKQYSEFTNWLHMNNYNTKYASAFK